MAELAVSVVISTELIDSDDEKPHRGTTRNWVERRDLGYLSNITKELKLEDRFGFRKMFQSDVGDFEYVLGQISDLISPKERVGGNWPIQSENIVISDVCLLV